jgi:hypothetical protein
MANSNPRRPTRPSNPAARPSAGLAPLHSDSQAQHAPASSESTDWLGERLHRPDAAASATPGQTPFEQLQRPGRSSAHTEGAGRATESRRSAHK